MGSNPSAPDQLGITRKKDSSRFGLQPQQVLIVYFSEVPRVETEDTKPASQPTEHGIGNELWNLLLVHGSRPLSCSCSLTLAKGLC
jgi:hypothetical protein